MNQNILKKFLDLEKSDVFFFNFMYYLFKVFGLLPVRYNSEWKYEDDSCASIFKFSPIGVMYNVLLCIFLSVFIAYGLYTDFCSLSFDSITYKVLINFTITYTAIVNVILIMQVFISNRSKIIIIGNEINKIRLQVGKPYFMEKKIIFISFAQLIITLAIQRILFYYNFKIVYIHDLHIFITQLVLIQYGAVVNMFEGFHKFITDSLNELILKHPDKPVENKDLILELDKLMKLYRRLYSLFNDVIDFFICPEVYAICNFFFNGVWCKYILISQVFLIRTLTFSEQTIYWIYIFQSFFSIFILIVDFSKLLQEVINFDIF